MRALERKYRASLPPRCNCVQNFLRPGVEGERAGSAIGFESPPHPRPDIAGKDHGARRRMCGERRHAVAIDRMKRAARIKPRLEQCLLDPGQCHEFERQRQEKLWQQPCAAIDRAPPPLDAALENNAGTLKVTRGAGAVQLGQGWGSRNSARGRTAVKLPQVAQAYS